MERFLLLIACAFLLASVEPTSSQTPAAPPPPEQLSDEGVWLSFQGKKSDVSRLLNEIQASDSGPDQATLDQLTNAVNEAQQDLSDYATKFPTGPHAWEGKFETVNILAIQLRLKNDPDIVAKLVPQYQALVATQACPLEIRRLARMKLLVSEVQKLVGSGRPDPTQLIALDTLITTFQQQYESGKTLRDSPVPKLRSMQLGMLKELPQHDMFDDLVKRLLNDSNTQVVALALREQKESAVMKNLATTPIDLSFTSMDAQLIDLKKMRGKVILVEFWATWDGPSRHEASHVVDLFNKFHEKGLEVVGISFDQDRYQLAEVTRDLGMYWPEYFDGTGWDNKIGQQYGINELPTLWLINKKGLVVSTNPSQDLDSLVAKLLAEP